MSTSTRLLAFIPDTDETYQKQKKVLIACYEGGIQSLPKETADYFGYTYPEIGAIEDKLKVKLIEGTHYKNWSDANSDGFEIDIKDLPKGVTKLFFNFILINNKNGDKK